MSLCPQPLGIEQHVIYVQLGTQNILNQAIFVPIAIDIETQVINVHLGIKNS